MLQVNVYLKKKENPIWFHLAPSRDYFCLDSAYRAMYVIYININMKFPQGYWLNFS